jgi:hypothetical protein
MSGRLLPARACSYPLCGSARGRKCRVRRQRHDKGVRQGGSLGVNGNDSAGVREGVIHYLHRTLKRAGQDGAGSTL